MLQVVAGTAAAGATVLVGVITWKLVDGAPKPVFVKLGLTDGSSTQLIDGDLQPNDLLITEVQGLPTTTRKVGAF